MPAMAPSPALEAVTACETVVGLVGTCFSMAVSLATSRSAGKSQWDRPLPLRRGHVERGRPEILLIHKKIARERLQVNRGQREVREIFRRLWRGTARLFSSAGVCAQADSADPQSNTRSQTAATTRSRTDLTRAASSFRGWRQSSLSKLHFTASR